MTADKPARLREFLRRMEAAAPCDSAVSALTLLEDTLNAVEDQMTSIPFNPASHVSDGRMYPPQSDSERAVPGDDGVRRYRNAGHNTYVGANGAIKIVEVKGACVLDKAGKDGQRIDFQRPTPTLGRLGLRR